MRDDSLLKRKKKSKPGPKGAPDEAQDLPDLQEIRVLLDKFGKIAERMNNAGKNFAKASLRMQLGLEQFQAANERLKQLQAPKN
jgi:hypothetical protein